MRVFRQLNDATKIRISQSLKGRTMSDSHKEAISQSMKEYWKTIPNRPQKNNEEKNKENEKNM